MKLRSLFFLILFPVLITLPVLLLAASTARFSASLALVPVGLILAYSSARLATMAASSSLRIVAATFWIFIYIFLGVAPFLQIATQQFPWPGHYDDTLLVKSCFIVITGLIAFEFGQNFLPTRKAAFLPGILNRPINSSIIPILGVAALASIPYLLSRIGGAETVFMPRSVKSQLLMSDIELPIMMLLTHGLSTPIYVLSIAALVVWIARHKRGQRVSWVWKAMTIIILATTLILNNPISTARFKVGTILLSILFVLPWRRWSAGVAISGTVFGLLLVFPFADLFRSTLDTNLSSRLSQTSAISELTENGDYDAFQMITNAVMVFEQSGTDFQLGSQISGALLFWVPRSIWQNKPIATGEWLAEQQGYGYTNLSAPLWAEFFIDGGWFLLMVGFVVYGYFVRVVDRWHAVSHNSGQARVVSILVPIYAGYQFFLLRGALMPALAYLAPIVLVALVCGLHTSRGQFKVRHQRRGPALSSPRPSTGQ
jgi:hypothetical protein